MTDAAFAETCERLSGYFLIEPENLDEAIAIAGLISAAPKGAFKI